MGKKGVVLQKVHGPEGLEVGPLESKLDELIMFKTVKS